MGQKVPKAGQLRLGGQGAEQEQVGGLLIAKAALGHEAANEVLNIDASIDELAVHRDLLSVLDIVAADVADLGDARHHAGAVSVAQAALDAIALIHRRIYFVILSVLPAYSLNIGQGLFVAGQRGGWERHSGSLLYENWFLFYFSAIKGLSQCTKWKRSCENTGKNLK